MAEASKKINQPLSPTCQNCVHYDQMKDSDEDMLQHIVADLRQQNVRITPQRQAILDYMIRTSAHPTVEEIYQDLILEFPGLSLATVYNNLHVLVDYGIIHEMKFSDVTHYDFMGHQHGHMICSNCGKISDFEVPGLKEIMEYAEYETSYQVTHTNIEMVGLCPCCQGCILNPHNQS